MLSLKRLSRLFEKQTSWTSKTFKTNIFQVFFSFFSVLNETIKTKISDADKKQLQKSFRDRNKKAEQKKRR